MAEHLRDVHAMLASDLALDRPFFDEQVRRRGLEDAWRLVSAPD